MYNSAAALIIRIENTFRDEFGLRHRLGINSEESSESREFNFFFEFSILPFRPMKLIPQRTNSTEL